MKKTTCLLFLAFPLVFIAGCGLTEKQKEKLSSKLEASVKKSLEKSADRLAAQIDKAFKDDRDITREEMKKIVAEYGKNVGAETIKEFRKRVRDMETEGMPDWLKWLLGLAVGGIGAGGPSFAFGHGRGRRDERESIKNA